MSSIQNGVKNLLNSYLNSFALLYVRIFHIESVKIYREIVFLSISLCIASQIVILEMMLASFSVGFIVYSTDKIHVTTSFPCICVG